MFHICLYSLIYVYVYIHVVLFSNIYIYTLYLYIVAEPLDKATRWHAQIEQMWHYAEYAKISWNINNNSETRGVSTSAPGSAIQKTVYVAPLLSLIEGAP